jgi:rRNA-processing protein EBP2
MITSIVCPRVSVFHLDFVSYRLAQAAVLAGIPRLKKEGARTRKPNDYFAEMAKSDEHMQRVRHRLLDEERRAEESAKARRLRELKKFGKQTQVAVLQRRQEEKRQLMDQIKKFRKGQKDALDFLDKPGAGAPAGGKKEEKRNAQSSKRFVLVDVPCICESHNCVALGLST